MLYSTLSISNLFSSCAGIRSFWHPLGAASVLIPYHIFYQRQVKGAACWRLLQSREFAEEEWCKQCILDWALSTFLFVSGLQSTWGLLLLWRSTFWVTLYMCSEWLTFASDYTGRGMPSNKNASTTKSHTRILHRFCTQNPFYWLHPLLNFFKSLPKFGFSIIL
jgi:hypothetical protein